MVRHHWATRPPADNRDGRFAQNRPDFMFRCRGCPIGERALRPGGRMIGQQRGEMRRGAADGRFFGLSVGQRRVLYLSCEDREGGASLATAPHMRSLGNRSRQPSRIAKRSGSRRPRRGSLGARPSDRLHDHAGLHVPHGTRARIRVRGHSGASPTLTRGMEARPPSEALRERPRRPHPRGSGRCGSHRPPSQSKRQQTRSRREKDIRAPPAGITACARGGPCIRKPHLARERARGAYRAPRPRPVKSPTSAAWIKRCDLPGMTMRTCSIIRRPVENTDLFMFESLEAGDVVFVDNSHRSFMNSDVTVVMLDILPRLKPGVLVEFHDIFLPSTILKRGRTALITSSICWPAICWRIPRTLTCSSATIGHGPDETTSRSLPVFGISSARM